MDRSIKDEYFQKISINELKRELKELDQIDLKRSSFESILKKVKKIFNGVVLFRIALKFKKKKSDDRFGLFRARRVDGTFDIQNPESYWAKPPQLQSEYGRCHAIGESKFYGSNYLLSTLLECRAKVASEWAIARFEGIGDPIFESIFLGGVSSGFDRMLGHQGIFDSFFSRVSKSEKKKNNLLYKYISKKLGEKINSPDKYKLTSAISHFFFKNEKSSSNVECIIYPSLMTKKRILNFAIDPDSARNKLRVVKIYHVKIESITMKDNEDSSIQLIKAWDISYGEQSMNKQIALNILNDFKELSNLELQRELWFKGIKGQSSYSELICRLFDENCLEMYVEKRFFPEEIREKLSILIDKLNHFDGDSMEQEAILNSPKWIEISGEAAKLLPLLKTFFVSSTVSNIK